MGHNRAAQSKEGLQAQAIRKAGEEGQERGSKSTGIRVGVKR